MDQAATAAVLVTLPSDARARWSKGIQPRSRKSVMQHNHTTMAVSARPDTARTAAGRRGRTPGRGGDRMKS
jgi:hypothetical protein